MMVFCRSLAIVSGILTVLACSPLPANEIVPVFSADDPEGAGLPPLITRSAYAPTTASVSQAETLTSSLLPPACSDDGTNCCRTFNGPISTNEFGGGARNERSYVVRFVPYGWLFAIYGDVTVRGLTAPVDVSIRDTLNLLEHDVHFLFAGKLEVESDEMGLIVNGLYINAGLENSLRRLNFDSTFKMAIVDIAATYNLASDPESFPLPFVSRFDILAGVRYWQLDGSVTVTGPLGNSRGQSGQREWVDPIIGGRIIVPIGEGIEGQLRGDVGGFDWGTASNFTWNLEALVSICCCEWMSLRGGYRVLDVDNQQGSGRNRFGFDVQFRGPVVEIAFKF